MTMMDPPSPTASTFAEATADKPARQARETELALVARLRAGDTDAFDLVYEAFHARLFNFLARLARNRDTAEDLAEETWLRFVDHAPKLKPDTTLAPLLFTIARNLHVSYCRSRSLEDSYSVDLVGLWPSASTRPSPFESVVANETGLRIEKALAAMPAIYREALLLVTVEGMKPAEAAVVCGVSPEAMRQRISRARALVTQELDPDNQLLLATLKAVTT
jgi:RNA polymerase sigma-70 factor (ECF subfamily)